MPHQTLPRFDIRKPDSREQGELWRQALGLGRRASLGRSSDWSQPV